MTEEVVDTLEEKKGAEEMPEVDPEAQEQTTTPAESEDPEKEEVPEEDDGLEDEDREYSERVQRRIAQKTKQHREEQRRADEESRKAEYWEREAKRLAADREPKPTQSPEQREEQLPDAPPQEQDFDSFDDYLDAKIRFNTAQEERDRTLRNEYQAKVERFDKSMKDAEKRIPDFAKKVYRTVDEGGPPLSEAVYYSVMESPHAGDVAYWLAEHPAEAQRLAGLPERAAAVEIGLISAKFADGSASNAPPRTTNAPPVIEQKVGSANKGGKTNPDDLPIEEWMDLSKKGELTY